MLTMVEIVYVLIAFIAGWISCTVIGTLAMRYAGTKLVKNGKDK